AAEREAVRQFGDVAGVRENCVIMDESRERAMQRANMIEELRQDVGFAFRSLRRNAGFGAVVVGALALGIGANTAIFTLIDATLVRTLPVPEPRALVAVGNTARVNSSSEGFAANRSPVVSAVPRRARSQSRLLGRVGQRTVRAHRRAH